MLSIPLFVFLWGWCLGCHGSRRTSRIGLARPPAADTLLDTLSLATRFNRTWSTTILTSRTEMLGHLLHLEPDRGAANSILLDPLIQSPVTCRCSERAHGETQCEIKPIGFLPSQLAL